MNRQVITTYYIYIYRGYTRAITYSKITETRLSVRDVLSDVLEDLRQAERAKRFRFVRAVQESAKILRGCGQRRRHGDQVGFHARNHLRAVGGDEILMTASEDHRVLVGAEKLRYLIGVLCEHFYI